MASMNRFAAQLWMDRMSHPNCTFDMMNWMLSNASASLPL